MCLRQVSSLGNTAIHFPRLLGGEVGDLWARTYDTPMKQLKEFHQIFFFWRAVVCGLVCLLPFVH